MSGTKSFSPDQVQLYIGTPPDALSGTMTVLMKTNKYYTDGSLKQAKTSYTVTREWGRMAVEAGWAEDTGDVLPVQDAPAFQEGAVEALSALVAASGNLLSPLFVAKTNQQVTRTSANTAADNTFESLYSFTIPGGSMGPNGTLRWEAEVSFTDPATSVTNNGFQLRIGSTGICPEYSITTSGNTNDNRGSEWHNTATGAQKYRGSFVKQSGSATGFTTTAVDTTVDQTVTFDCRWSAATSAEVLRLESLRVWVEYGA